MSVKALLGRLRRHESKSGSSLSKCYAQLSEEELGAFVRAKGLPLHEQANALADELGWSIQQARLALDETARLSAQHFFGWSDERLCEYLSDVCAEAGMRDQLEIWLREA